MKRFLLVLFAFSLFFVSCKEQSPVKSISIANPKTEFVIGEKFSAGEEFVLTAVYEDGSEKQISSKKCKFIVGNGIKKNIFEKAGSYTIIVEYADKTLSYSVSVSDQGIIKRNFKKVVFTCCVAVVLLFIFIFRRQIGKKLYQSRVSSSKKNDVTSENVSTTEEKENLREIPGFLGVSNNSFIEKGE